MKVSKRLPEPWISCSGGTRAAEALRAKGLRFGGLGLRC